MPNINKRAVFAQIHQDTIGDQPHIFSIKYVKKDGTVGKKKSVSKSTKQLSGEKKYRQNVNLNNILLLKDHDPLAAYSHFEVLNDLIIEYNGQRIIHNY